MRLCSEGHDEICYEARNCPACSLFETIKDLENQAIENQKIIEKLVEEKISLEYELKKYSLKGV